MRHLIVSVLALVLFTEPAHAQAVWMEGKLGCDSWLNNRTSNTALAAEHLAIGYLNGVSGATKRDFWKSGPSNAVSRDQVFLWLDDYCRTNPTKSAYDGLGKLFLEMKPVPRPKT